MPYSSAKADCWNKAIGPPKFSKPFPINKLPKAFPIKRKESLKSMNACFNPLPNGK